MDTISRESSPSYLPIAGLVVGILGVILGGVGLANAAKANRAATEASAKVAEQVDRIGTIESTANGAASSVDNALRNINTLKSSTQEGFNLVSVELGKTNAELAKLQEAATKKGSAKADGKAPAGPVTAGPDEYVIKAGDTFAKIGRAQGVSSADIAAVNPGVDSSKLKVGQKIKLPAKK